LQAAAAAREAAKAKKRRQAMSDEKLLKVVNGLIEAMAMAAMGNPWFSKGMPGGMDHQNM